MTDKTVRHMVHVTPHLHEMARSSSAESGQTIVSTVERWFRQGDLIDRASPASGTDAEIADALRRDFWTVPRLRAMIAAMARIGAAAQQELEQRQKGVDA